MAIQFDPEAMSAGRNYLSACQFDIDFYKPDEKLLEAFGQSLIHLVGVSDEIAECVEPTGPLELRWVPIARALIKKCAKTMPNRNGVGAERTLIFADDNTEMQAELYLATKK